MHIPESFRTFALVFSSLSRVITAFRAGKLTPDELAALPAPEREKAEQLRELLASYQTRFDKQLSGAPDPQAPLLPKTSPDYRPNSSKPQQRRYHTLSSFLRAIISLELKPEKVGE